STREDGEGVRHDASLQITDMALSPVSGEQPKTAAQTLYGGEDD
ncbi:capsid staple protein, partial [Escherichia coli]